VTQLTRDAPPCFPSRVHCLIDLFVNLVSFFIILFVCHSGKETILVIWVLELFRIHVLLPSPSTGFTNIKLVSEERKKNKTYAMTSSEGPSRAGPISERVVKPEALGISSVHTFLERGRLDAPSTKTSNIGGWCWHRQKGQLVGFVFGRHGELE
jgi:hypothetical protein